VAASDGDGLRAGGPDIESEDQWTVAMFSSAGAGGRRVSDDLVERSRERRHASPTASPAGSAIRLSSAGNGARQRRVPPRSTRSRAPRNTNPASIGQRGARHGMSRGEGADWRAGFAARGSRRRRARGGAEKCPALSNTRTFSATASNKPARIARAPGPRPLFARWVMSLFRITGAPGPRGRRAVGRAAGNGAGFLDRQREPFDQLAEEIAGALGKATTVFAEYFHPPRKFRATENPWLPMETTVAAGRRQIDRQARA